MAAENGGGKPANCHRVIVVTMPDLGDQEQHQRTRIEQQTRQHQHDKDDKATHGICLLFLSALLFSIMGMFLQFTGRMGLPSTELVFARSVFQVTFVLLGMFTFRVDDSISNGASKDNKAEAGVDDVKVGKDNNLDAEGVGMVLVHAELLEEEKKLEDDVGCTTSPNCAREDAPLLATATEHTYSTLSTLTTHESFEPPPLDVHSLAPLIIQRPFGTTATMRKIVILRGIIGGFGFINFYYTLSTLPLGDATTLLSLYPVFTIFLARIVLGEELKPLNVVAGLLSVIGATLISRPSFLFDTEDEDTNHQKNPKLGYVTAIVGSCCASGVIVLIRKAGKVGAHTLQLLFSWSVFGLSFSLLVGFICASTEADQKWRMPSQRELPSVLGVCVSGTAAHFLLNYAAKLVPATLGGLLRSSDILWAYLLEMIVLSEHPPKATWWGVLLICSTLVSILLASNKTSNNMKQFESVGNLTAAK